MKARGFTLIEIMIVVFIIVILVSITVAVGTGVRQSGQVKATALTLRQLAGIHADYVQDGNAAPRGALVPNPNTNTPQMNMFPQPYASNTNYIPGEVIIYNGTFYRCVTGTNQTPDAQPTRWDTSGIALTGYWLFDIQQYPAAAKALRSLPDSALKTGTYTLGGSPVTLVSAVQDGFGVAVGYVPPPLAKGPFFVSMGPDGLYTGSSAYCPGATSAASGNNADNIHSFDP